MPDQKTMRTRCLGGFSVMWVTKLLISPGKIRIFCPKLAFLFILGRLIWCPVGGLVGGCGARAVSRNTPNYFIWDKIIGTNLCINSCLIVDKAGAEPLASDASGGFVECQSQYWSSLRHPVHPHFLVCKIFSFRNQDAYKNSMMYVHWTLYRVVFNCSAQISVLKRKMLFNQRGSFVYREFHGTESFIGCPSFFILVLKIGRNS